MSNVTEHSRQISNGSRTSGDDLSIDECERMVLSPPPVPMDLYTACDAINAAARRSNSSRTHSIQTQPTDGWGDSDNRSTPDLREKRYKRMLIFNKGGNFQSSNWSRLLCCFSPRANVRTVDAAQKPFEDAHHSDNTPNANHVNSTFRTPSRVKKRFKLWPFRRSSKASKREHPPVQGDGQLPPDRDIIPIDDRDTSEPAVSTYHPTLPSSVLNALSSDRSTVPCTSTGVNNSRNTADCTSSTATSHTSAIMKKNAFPSVFQKLPGFRHTEPEKDQQEADQVDMTRGNHVSHWVGGDALDHTTIMVSDRDQHVYQIDVDQNGAQGDSSSENMEGLTPGMDLLGEVPPDCANKKCLVLDLDETLVHSWFKYVDNASFIVPVELDGIKHQIYVCKRPHLDEFLRAVGPLFECVMFTASLRKYADPVCDYIDGTSCFRHRLFREACVYHQNNLIKDLSRLGRDIDQICILDNSPVSFLFQPNNALQIVSWFDDPNDRALLELIPYFQGLAKSDTVVDYLREFRPPPSAAVAQPPTPSWFFLFDTSGGQSNEMEDSGDPMDDAAAGYEYTEEEEAVLSPHFHPPVPFRSSNTSALVRSYLTQLDSQHHHPVPPRPSVNHRSTTTPANTLVTQLAGPTDGPRNRVPNSVEVMHNSHV